jgi:hypothetical protein
MPNALGNRVLPQSVGEAERPPVVTPLPAYHSTDTPGPSYRRNSASKRHHHLVCELSPGSWASDGVAVATTARAVRIDKRRVIIWRPLH